jgi:hypothetical protein
MEQRSRMLVELLNRTGPIRELVARLSEFPWDSDEVLALVERCHLKAALEKYLVGAMPANEVEEWAEALEGREDIGFESGAEDLISDVLWTLATPALTEPLSEMLARRLLARCYGT